MKCWHFQNVGDHLYSTVLPVQGKNHSAPWNLGSADTQSFLNEHPSLSNDAALSGPQFLICQQEGWV